jgi:hypothetical protein
MRTAFFRDIHNIEFEGKCFEKKCKQAGEEE